MLIENAIHSQQVYDPTDDSIMAEQELCMERLLEQLPNGYSDHYVPDGFERDYEQGYDDAQAFLHVYTDIMTNDFYTVSCAIVQNQNQKELFDNEHTKYRKVKMGDVEALLGEDKNTGYYLVWEDEGITHTIIGRISIRELMLVAQKIY